MVKIVVRRFGIVKDSFVSEVLEVMDDCYKRINSSAVKIVDLYLFDRSSRMYALMNEEKRRLGIGTSAFELSFFATHDAWRGTSRIMASHDKMLDLPNLVVMGGLHHEVAHTILHGSLEYYLFSFPMSLLKLEMEGLISRKIMGDLLYLASIAVKDYEVTRLLYGKGYVEDQVAYNRYFLEPSKEDLEAWNIAKKSEAIRPLVLASLLKTACCAAPLLDDERYGGEIAEYIARGMSHLPTSLSERLLKILEVTSNFGENIQENVDFLVRKITDEFIARKG